ncbi:MAG: ImmA/IrrE family metallo-endopeptidase [Peptostreptococcales bacterium]
MTYEELLNKVNMEGIEVFENNYIGKLKGLYVDNTITINTNIETETDKKCTLVEELGHHYKTAGDILDQSNINNRKQERLARAWGYENLISLQNIIQAKKEGIRNKYELAEYLEVTEEFLCDALKYYKNKCEKVCMIGKYVIGFEPLEVYEKVNFNK